MGQLIFLEHLSLHKRLQCIDLAIGLALDQLHLTKCPFANDLDGAEITWLLFGAQEAQVLDLCFADVFCLLSLACCRNVWVVENLLQLGSTMRCNLSATPLHKQSEL